MNGMLIMSFLLAAFVIAAQEQQKPRADAAAADQVARGKYLVEHVAMCVECHTPRDEHGTLLRDRYLEGAPIPLKSPPYPRMKWAIMAPVIAGLPGYTEEEGVRLLMKGVTRDGRTPDPPMPAFRLNRADAEAIVAYLRSLR
jgi:mono/diheme cytochrome c family protein